MDVAMPSEVGEMLRFHAAEYRSRGEVWIAIADILDHAAWKCDLASRQDYGTDDE